MATVTITGTIKNAIRDVPITNNTVNLALVEVFENGDIGYLTEEAEYKVDGDGDINGSGVDIIVPDSGEATYSVNLPSAIIDGQETIEILAIDASPSTQKIEDLVYGGTAPDGGTITISGELRNPLNNLPYANAFVTVTMRELFTTQDGIYPPTTTLVKVSQGLFNGADGLIVYVPEGEPSQWTFLFPDGTSVLAQLGTNTNMVEIADILDGDYVEYLDFMNPVTSFNAVQDGVDVDLTWDDTNSDETGYRIERSDDSGATWDAVTVTSAGATSYTDTAPPDDDYIYRIRAEKSGGQSAWVTDTVSVTLFSPEDLSDLVFWLDASDSTTLFQDTGATTPVTADGQSVARWNDKSISANNVTQGTGANRPTRQTSGGYVGVRFDGTNDNLTGTVLSELTDLSIFAAVRITTTSMSGAIYKNGDSGDGWGLGFGDATLDSDGNNLIWLWEQLQWRATTSNTQIGRHLETALITGANGSRVTTMREDGAEIYSQPSSDGNAPTASLLIGGYFRDTDRYFNGDILELLIYTQALDAGEINQVESYLTNKWGIS